MGVDLQVNGQLGIGFDDPNLTAEQTRTTFRACLEHCDGFVATIVTAAPETLVRNLRMVGRITAEPEFIGRVHGLHLEGPFLSAARGAVGAHEPAWIQPPTVGAWRWLFDAAEGRIRILTIAADVPGAADVCAAAVDDGVIVGLGHHLATVDDLARLADAGATLLTHLGNGLPLELHRHHNPLLAALASRGLDPTIIADGHHLPPHVIRLIVDHFGPQRVTVISDAANLAGLPPGRYRHRDGWVSLEPDGKLWDPAGGWLAGSSRNMAQCIDHLRQLGYSAADIAQMTDINPRRILGR